MAFDGTDPCWIPRVPISDAAERRLRVAQFDDGYQQRILDGINTLERKWPLRWEMKPEADLAAMQGYLSNHLGYAFKFRHPVTLVDHQVFCDDWQISWDHRRSSGEYYGTLSAEFRQANGADIELYPYWVLAPDDIPPVLQIDFVNNRGWSASAGSSVTVTATSLVTVTRNSVAMIDHPATGDWSSVAANVMRRDSRGVLVERASANYVKNSTWVGAVAGTPGTAPSPWAFMTPPGVTQTIVGTGVEDGIDYIDVRWVGTASALAAMGIAWPSTGGAGAATAVGETWTSSYYVRLTAGSFAGITTSQCGAVTWEAVAGGSAQGAGITQVNYVATSAPLRTQRVASTRTMSVAGTVLVFTQWRMTVPNGAAIDITLRFGWPQLEKCEFVTTPILTTNAVVTRAADVISVTDPTIIKNGTGTLYVKFNVIKPLTARTLGAIVPFSWSKDGANFQLIYMNAGSGYSYAQNCVASVHSFDPTNTLSALTDTASHKTAFATAANNGIFAKDGFLTSLDTTLSVVPGPAAAINIGAAGSSLFIDGFVQEAAIWNRRLTNAQLTELTS